MFKKLLEKIKVWWSTSKINPILSKIGKAIRQFLVTRLSRKRSIIKANWRPRQLIVLIKLKEIFIQTNERKK